MRENKKLKSGIIKETDEKFLRKIEVQNTIIRKILGEIQVDTEPERKMFPEDSDNFDFEGDENEITNNS
ncbi:MAG: hypothetical protein CVT94_18965 [Bacteroidetes bacterium HGW-Bacteroidetes-11]|jgi:hypothetical protein|nr:MAG: hypothetical protein CVT94_18965 [Bacteroidetes bacterium HGW-Bacteroidetes-11]